MLRKSSSGKKIRIFLLKKFLLKPAKSSLLNPVLQKAVFFSEEYEKSFSFFRFSGNYKKFFFRQTISSFQHSTISLFFVPKVEFWGLA